MDHVPAGDTTSDTVRARRRRMREQARSRHPGSTPDSHGFETPEWLDRSFVLPLTQPDVNDVAQDLPHQPRRSHDDDTTPPEVVADPGPGTSPAFVRPSTPEIDFAKVMRRSDLSRTASRSALAAGGLAGLSLITFLLTTSMLVLGMAIAFGVVALVAVIVRVRLETATIPHVDH